jgi:hypothetical protein
MRPFSSGLSKFKITPTTHASLAHTPYRVFDRYAKFLQKERAAVRNNGEDSRRVDYLRDEVAERMLERFQVLSTSQNCSLLQPHHLKGY